jgi:hypothetical protein
MADTAPLPVDDEGFIMTSAEFGQSAMVIVEYNTDFDGREIDPAKEEHPRTFHGPFTDMDEASKWMDAYPDDTDVHDMTAVPLNNVRPS